MFFLSKRCTWRQCSIQYFLVEVLSVDDLREILGAIGVAGEVHTNSYILPLMLTSSCSLVLTIVTVSELQYLVRISCLTCLWLLIHFVSPPVHCSGIASLKLGMSFPEKLTLALLMFIWLIMYISSDYCYCRQALVLGAYLRFDFFALTDSFPFCCSLSFWTMSTGTIGGYQPDKWTCSSIVVRAQYVNQTLWWVVPFSDSLKPDTWGVLGAFPWESPVCSPVDRFAGQPTETHLIDSVCWHRTWCRCLHSESFLMRVFYSEWPCLELLVPGMFDSFFPFFLSYSQSTEQHDACVCCHLWQCYYQCAR